MAVTLVSLPLEVKAADLKIAGDTSRIILNSHGQSAATVPMEMVAHNQTLSLAGVMSAEDMVTISGASLNAMVATIGTLNASLGAALTEVAVLKAKFAVMEQFVGLQPPSQPPPAPAPFTVPAGVTLHLDASAHTSPTDSSPNAWTLGYERGAATTTSANLVNGKPGWDMQGRCLYVNNVQLNTQATLFVVSVTRSNLAATWANQFTHGSRDKDVVLERNSGTGDMHLQSCDDNLGANLAYSLNTPTIWSGRYQTSGTKRIFWKTTRSSSGSPSKVTTSANTNCISAGSKRIRIGCSDAGELFNGHYSEVIYYNTALSDTQMQAVTDGLFNKWLA